MAHPQSIIPKVPLPGDYLVLFGLPQTILTKERSQSNHSKFGLYLPFEKSIYWYNLGNFAKIVRA